MCYDVSTDWDLNIKIIH